MIFRNFAFFSILLVSVFASEAFATESTGWFPKGKEYVLLLEGKTIYDTSQGQAINLPSDLNNAQQIEAYLYLGEFFIKNKNKQGVATILYQIRLKSSEFRLGDAIITTLWKKTQNEESASQKTLESYIKIESNIYYKNLAKNIYTSLFTEGEDEKKSPVDLNCINKLPYYSICRVFRLQAFLDKTPAKSSEVNTQYANIMKVLSPFYEEGILQSVPLLGDLDQDLPPRLAFLGFANEAINFQRMILEAEKAAYENYTENSLERYAFFQVLAGKYSLAEASLNELLLVSKNRKASIKNRIYIKLGALAYLQKRYKESLDYYIKIDFNDWSSAILHPFFNESLSIPQAKDLIAVSVWRAQGSKVALQALRQIPSQEKIFQEEVWPRLRIAQILRDSNPELASRITDEISYLAQSRGWKRLEYSATVLQGYNHIDNQLYRKSTVEFTKSRGILSKEEQEFGSDWLRYTGLVFAHQASGQKSPVISFINDALAILKNEAPEEDFITVRNYKPAKYTKDGFIQTSLEALSDGNHAQTMMELLTAHRLSSIDLPGIFETGLFQINLVDNRLRYLSGFQSFRESIFHDSIYNQAREMEVSYLKKEREDISNSYSEDISSPVIAILPWQSSIYLFYTKGNSGKRNTWEYKLFSDVNANSFQIKQSLKEIAGSSLTEGTIQIYLNESGLTAFEFLRKEFQDQKFSLFYRFKTSQISSRNSNLMPVIWDAKQADSSSNAVDRMSFEGTKVLLQNYRLHIWDYELLQKSNRLLDMEWKNSNDSETISMKRVIRRMDERTIPTAILVSSRNLGDTSSFLNQNILLDWCSFWLRSGVGSVYFKKELKESAVPFYSKQPVGVSYKEDPDSVNINRDLF